MIHLARLTALKSGHPQFRHGVVVLKGGSVMALGKNFFWRHAEEDAIGQVSPERRNNLIVWSARITHAGKLASAKPCVKCMSLLRHSGVKRVYYSTSKGEIEWVKP